MRKLEAADYLVEQKARSEKNEEVPVFRLRIDKILWRLGDGETVKPDPIKRRAYKQQAPRPNEFFRDMYRDFAPVKAPPRRGPHRPRQDRRSRGP